jgi:hypothetical protein
MQISNLRNRIEILNILALSKYLYSSKKDISITKKCINFCILNLTSHFYHFKLKSDFQFFSVRNYLQESANVFLLKAHFTVYTGRRLFLWFMLLLEQRPVCASEQLLLFWLFRTVQDQCDQMSLCKIAQNVAQYFFDKN